MADVAEKRRDIMILKAMIISICLLSAVSIASCYESAYGISPNCYNTAYSGDGCSGYCHGNNQINQNLNQNAFGGGGSGGLSGGVFGLPQNGVNIANANDGKSYPCGGYCQRNPPMGNNKINQNLNQNALGIGGIGGLPGGFVWLPQNGINIANANGWGNSINQGLNQNAFGF